MASTDDDHILLEFLGCFAAERAEGRIRTLEEYLRLYPGREESITREYRNLTGPEQQAEPSAIQTGGKLGHYRLLRQIGRGGQAVVYLAEDLTIGRKVALKVLLAPLADPASGQLPARFQREAEAVARLDHPGICQVLDAGVSNGSAYIAMRFVPGQTLASDLEQRGGTAANDPIRQRQDLIIVEKLARAISAAHAAGVIHRDLKPGNVILRADGEPVILDFGIARDLESELSLTRTGDLFGTPHYMSPEQLGTGGGEIDGRADVWSLGVILHELLTGTRPFDAPTRDGLIYAILHDPLPNPARAGAGLGRDLIVLLQTALARDPRHRYQTAAALADDLARARRGEPILARPVGRIVRLLRWCARNTALASSLGGLFLALTAGLLVSLSLLRSTEERLTEVRRLSDLKVLEELTAAADRMWPAEPERIGGEDGMDAWLVQARELYARLDRHLESLTRLRAGAADGSPAGSGAEDWYFRDSSDRWWHQQLTQLVDGLVRFEEQILRMEERRRFAADVDRLTIDAHAAAWTEAIQSITRSPAYSGLVLSPQRGLVPLGPDPESGLEEFAHLQTGELARRDPDTGRIAFRAESGLVFVLIPGGRFAMGARPPDSDHPIGSPNVDPGAGKYEMPVHEIELDPFFLSKYEMSQAQWHRFTRSNPSGYSAERGFRDLDEPWTHPVEMLTWFEATATLGRLGLRLPTEAQWEYAARAGTTTVFWTGNAPRTLEGAVNIADRFLMTHGGPAGSTFEDWLDDGYASHAPVASFRPNPFGLHNILGNVAEWVRDPWETFDEVDPRSGDGLRWVDGRDNRLNRGGSYGRAAVEARSAFRAALPPDGAAMWLGLRPARALDR